MKRISVGSISTALQLPSQTQSSARKSSNPSQTDPQKKETPTANHVVTEKHAHFQLPHCLFAECFPCAYSSFQQNRTYRKLQYHSLDKKNNDKQSKNDQERKTMSLKDSFLSFGKEKLPNEIENGPIMKLVNQCVIADIVGSQGYQKYNVFNARKNTGRSSVMVSTMNSVEGCYEKYQSSINSKLFLSQDFKISNVLSPVQAIENIQVSKNNSKTKNLPGQCEISVKKRRLSTNDSIKLKKNGETDQSQTTNNPLEMASILCESIPVNQQNVNRLHAFEFDHMKDSLIDKLNLFRKQQSFIESKRKSFIRSKKNELQESPRFCNFEPISWNSSQRSHENEQEITNFDKIDSKQTVQQKFIRSKFKTLKECGQTIVSRYNKSSQQKSILQESNIVFQASKMCVDPYEQNVKIPTFSDSQFIFDNEIKENFDNEKAYNSFIHEIDSSGHHDLQMSNPNGNCIGKIVNRAFLRSKKSSSEKEIRCKDNDQMEIRFDLDTFIEYGPL